MNFLLFSFLKIVCVILPLLGLVAYSVLAGASNFTGSRLPHHGGDSIRLNAGRSENGHCRPERGDSLYVRDRVAWGLRDCAGRLRGKFQVSFSRRYSFERADDLLRDLDGDVGDSALSACRQPEAKRRDRLPGSSRLAAFLATALFRHLP